MSSGEFDVRMKVLEGRVEKAEGVLDSVGRVLGSIERAHDDTAERGRLVPLVLLGATAIAAASVVFVARRQQSA